MPKKNLILLGGGIAVVIIAAIVALSMTVWAPPSKKDFEQAKADVKKIDALYGDLGISLQAYSGSIREATPQGDSKRKATYEKAISNLAGRFEALNQSKVTKDTDVKLAYASLVKKQGVIVSYSEGFVLLEKSFATCVDVFSVTKNVSDGKKIAAAHKKAAADCLPVLTQMKKSNTPYFASYATNYANAINKRQKVFDDYAAGKVNDADASAKISEIASTDLKKVLGDDTGLSTARQNASSFEALKQLNKVLDQKIKQS